jgi:hypothetical protein
VGGGRGEDLLFWVGLFFLGGGVMWMERE